MTDERLYDLMGWKKGMEIVFVDLVFRVRALVETAERDEREACALAVLNEEVEDNEGCVEDGAYNLALVHAADAIRARK